MSQAGEKEVTGGLRSGTGRLPHTARPACQHQGVSLGHEDSLPKMKMMSYKQGPFDIPPWRFGAMGNPMMVSSLSHPSAT